MLSVSGMNWSLVSVLKANLGLSALSKASRLLVNNPRRYLNYYSKSVSDIKLCIVKIWGGLSSVYDTTVINTRWLQRQQSSYKMQKQGWVWIYWVILNNSDMSFFFYFCAILKLQLNLKDGNDFDLRDESVACIWINSKSRPLRFVEGLSTAKNPRSYLNYWSKSFSDIKLCMLRIWGGLSSCCDTIVINTQRVRFYKNKADMYIY